MTDTFAFYKKLLFPIRKRLTLLFPVIGIFLFPACKPPLPVYFDKPVGEQIPGFDTSISGNYLPMDDMIDKGKKEFTDRYEIRYDRIIPREQAAKDQGNDIGYNDVKDLLGSERDTLKQATSTINCDSVFRTIASFNPLVPATIGLDLDKMGPAVTVGAIKITYNRILFLGLDSTGANFCDTLIELSDKLVLSKYDGKYYLNFSTPFGWEILQMETWEENFLSAHLFYFTGYNGCAKDEKDLTSSTRTIYPGMTPVFGENRKVIGYRASMNPKTVAEKFHASEQSMLLMRLK